MKLQLIALLALLSCVIASEVVIGTAAANNEEVKSHDEDDGEDDGVVVDLPVDDLLPVPPVPLLPPPKTDIWEYIPIETDIAMDIPSSEVSSSGTSLQWSIMSFFAGMFQSFGAPIKRSESLPIIDIESTTVNLVEIAANFNCEASQLAKINMKSLESLVPCLASSRVEILACIAELKDNDLFELFYTENAAVIMAEVETRNVFHAVVFNCIKMDNINSFFDVMISPKFPLNGPQAVVFASMFGSIKILEFVLQQQESADYRWVWKNFDGTNGHMLDFGSDPLSAALFLGAIKAIENNHLDCLYILINHNVKLESKNFLLLKEATKQPNLELFINLLNSIPTAIPDRVMNEVLLIAIQKNNEALVNYILSLHYNYRAQFQQHLLSAITTKNSLLVSVIIKLVPDVPNDQIDSNVLNMAAAFGSVEIFTLLIKIASNAEILNALYSCILNEHYHHYVPLISVNVKFTSETISQALVHSVRIGSADFVKLYLSEAICTITAAKPGFMAAMDFNNIVILGLFSSKFQSSELMRITSKNLKDVMEKLFEKQAWESLSFFVNNYAIVPEFPKHLFMAMIMETDQVETAQNAVDAGLLFPQSKLVDVKNARMRDLVLSQAPMNSLAKSQVTRK